jgi:serine/threonine protein kinase
MVCKNPPVHVQEYCNAGTLRDAVLAGRFLAADAGGFECRWLAISACLRDVAAGMDYLHGRRCCHGDLNPANVLFKVPRCFVAMPQPWGVEFGCSVLRARCHDDTA